MILETMLWFPDLKAVFRSFIETYIYIYCDLDLTIQTFSLYSLISCTFEFPIFSYVESFEPSSFEHAK